MDAADVVQANALTDHFVTLLVEEVFEQKHEAIDLEGRAFPVLRGKSI
jgi:hypothetical protein